MKNPLIKSFSRFCAPNAIATLAKPAVASAGAMLISKTCNPISTATMIVTVAKML